MTALALERLTVFKGLGPSRGTYPIAANTRIFKGSIVALDSSGRAVPATTIALGALYCIGKASSTIDNRTGSELGGTAGAADVEVEFGIYLFANGDTIASTDLGKVLYASDDQTAVKSSSTSSLPVLGVLVEVPAAGGVAVLMGPHVVGPALFGSVQRRAVRVQHSDLVAAATSEAVAVGAPLPAGSQVLAVGVALATPFTGGGATSCVVDIGSTGDVDALIDGSNVFAAAVDGQASTRPLGIAPNKAFSAATQVNATFISDVNTVALTAGDATITVLYAVNG